MQKKKKLSKQEKILRKLRRYIIKNMELLNDL